MGCAVSRDTAASGEGPSQQRNASSLFPALAKRLRNNFRKSLDYSSGYVVLSVAHHLVSAADGGEFQHMIILPLDKFLEGFSEPATMAKLLRQKTTELIGEWTLLNGNRESAGNRTQTERMFTLFEHSWKTYGKVNHRSQCEMQLQTWGFTDLYNKVPVPPPMKSYDVKVIFEKTQERADGERKKRRRRRRRQRKRESCG